MGSVASILVVLLIVAVVVIVVVAIAAAASSKKQPVTGEGSYFDGNTFQLIGYYLLTGLVCTITLGIAYPWMLCMLQRWETKHTVIHGRRLAFNGHGHQLIGKFLLWVFLTLITFGIYGIWLGLGMKKWVVKHTVYADEEQPVDSYFSGGAGGYLGVHILAAVLTLFTFGIGKAWGDVAVLKWEAKHTHIGGSPLEFYGTGGGLFGKYLLFVLLTPLTLGIYALFFPVIYKKWQAKHTEAVYQTPAIQAAATAHELSAAQDHAKYRIAANDQEIAAMKSGYTGNEDAETLERLATENNPFAAYRLATVLKGDAAQYEGRALELLQSAAAHNYHPALLALAKQLPTEQRVPTLTTAAQCGSAEASWLLVGECMRSNTLPQAAYWFKVALEWGVPEAQHRAEEYPLLIKQIALDLSETRTAPKQSPVLAIVLAVVGLVVLVGIVGGVLAVLGIKRFDRAEPALEAVVSEDVEIMQSLPIDEVQGTRFSATGMEDREYEYVLNDEVFYDREKEVLYFELGKVSGAFDLFLCVGDWWKTDPIYQSGIFKVYYPYEVLSTLEISVREDNGLIYGGLLKFHTLHVTRGSTAEADAWLNEKYKTPTQADEPLTNDPEPTRAPTTTPPTTTPPTTPPASSIPVQLIGKWQHLDTYTNLETGDTGLDIWEWTFREDGTYSEVLKQCVPSVEGNEYHYGQAWLHAGGSGTDGTYTVEGNTLYLTFYDPYTEQYANSQFTFGAYEGTLRLNNAQWPMAREFEFVG